MVLKAAAAVGCPCIAIAELPTMKGRLAKVAGRRGGALHGFH